MSESNERGFVSATTIELAETRAKLAALDAEDAAAPQPAPAGVAAMFGAAPDLPEESLLFRTLAAEVDDEDLGARGIREYGERSREERAEAERLWAGLSDEDRERVWKHGVAICMPDANGSMRHNVATLADEWAKSSDIARGQEAHAVALQRPSYGETEPVFSLEGARALLENIEHCSDEAARVDLIVELRLACDAFERLQTDNANLRGAVEMLNVAAKEREGEIERLIRERSAAYAETARLRVDRDVSDQGLRAAIAERDEERAAAASLRERCLARVDDDRGNRVRLSEIEAALEVQICDPDKPIADRLSRINALTLLRNRAARAKAETLARWKRRASKAERRIAALTEERDGLTVRLGKKVRKQVKRKVKRLAGATLARGVATAQGDDVAGQIAAGVRAAAATGRYAKAGREMLEGARKVTRAKGRRS